MAIFSIIGVIIIVLIFLCLFATFIMMVVNAIRENTYKEDIKDVNNTTKTKEDNYE